MSSPKPATIIYIGDPMCSWCYGISEELETVKSHYGETLDFEMVMGGLRPYNPQKMIELKDFLSHHWDDVAKASGQKFCKDILDSTTITYDTEPPCRASVIVRHMAPDKEFAFFKAIQKSFYAENKNMHLVESYHGVLNEMNLDTVQFDKLFNSQEMKLSVKADFQRSADLGVRGFPTILIKKGDQYTLIANGFATASNMIAKIDQVLSQ